MNQKQISSCAKTFWSLLEDKPDSYPLDVAFYAAKALDLVVISLPALSGRVIAEWLTDRSISYPIEQSMSPMKGGVIAYRGVGIIFVNQLESPEETRFTLAHEIAHFFLHYYLPRLKAIEFFGHSIVDVLDGVRLPTDGEMLSGVISGIPIGSYAHSWKVSGADDQSEAMEIEADLLAFEILAPRALVRNRLANGSDLQLVLEKEFGLPRWAADAYARMVNPKKPDSGGFADWLRS